MQSPYQHNPRASRQHTCDGCIAPIRPKEHYHLLTFYTDRIYKVKLCSACHAIYTDWYAAASQHFTDVGELLDAIATDARALNAVEAAEAQADLAIEEQRTSQLEETS
jgi:Zn-finger protein